MWVLGHWLALLRESGRLRNPCFSSFGTDAHIGTLCGDSCFCPAGLERGSGCTRTEVTDSSRYGNVSRAIGAGGRVLALGILETRVWAGAALGRTRETKLIPLGPAEWHTR